MWPREYPGTYRTSIKVLCTFVSMAGVKVNAPAGMQPEIFDSG